MIICKRLATYNALMVPLKNFLQASEATEVIRQNSPFDAPQAHYAWNWVQRWKNDHVPTLGAIEFDWSVVRTPRLLEDVGMIICKRLTSYNVLVVPLKNYLQASEVTEVTLENSIFDALQAI